MQCCAAVNIGVIADHISCLDLVHLNDKGSIGPSNGYIVSSGDRDGNVLTGQTDRVGCCRHGHTTVVIDGDAICRGHGLSNWYVLAESVVKSKVPVDGSVMVATVDAAPVDGEGAERGQGAFQVGTDYCSTSRACALIVRSHQRLIAKIEVVETN